MVNKFASLLRRIIHIKLEIQVFEINFINFIC